MQQQTRVYVSEIYFYIYAYISTFWQLYWISRVYKLFVICKTVSKRANLCTELGPPVLWVIDPSLCSFTQTISVDSLLTDATVKLK